MGPSQEGDLQVTASETPHRALTALVALACCVAGVLAGPPLASAAATWLPQQQVSDGTQWAYGNAVAVAPQGTVAVGWIQTDGSHYRMQVRMRPPGGPWAAVQTLSAPGASASDPQVAFDSQGNAIAVWGLNGIIQWAMAPAGGAFGPAQDLSPAGEGAQNPRIAFDSQGNAVVVWVGNVVTTGMTTSQTLYVRYAVRPAGGSFGAVGLMDSANTSDVSSTMISAYVTPLAVDAQGHVSAVWQFSSQSMSISGSQYSGTLKEADHTAGGTFSSPATLMSVGPSMTVDLLQSPVVADDPQGDTFVAWDHVNNSGSVMQGKIRPAGGAFELNPETITSGNGNSPQVALDNAGDVFVGFQGYYNGGSTIVAQVIERPANGGFGSPQELDSTMSYGPALGVNTSGDVIAVFPEGNTVEGAVRPAGAGSFGAPTPLSTGGINPVDMVAAPDGHGDVVGGWATVVGSPGTRVPVIAPYDDSAPLLENLGIPSAGTVGSPLSFGVTPVSIWSSIASTSWLFGDGGTASGANVTHAFGAPGSFPVKVTATDALGNSASLSGMTAIAAAPSSTTGGGAGGAGGGGSSGGTGGTLAKAAILGVGETNSVFAVGGASTPLTGIAAARRHPKGTTFSLTLDRAATIRIAIQTTAPGRRVGRSCRANSRKLRRRPRCTRTITIATLTRVGHAGLNKVAFTGRIKGRALKPGRYRAVFTAANAAGASAAKTLSFTIVKR